MNTQICPTCHAPIPPHAPGGFCPACLLRDAEEPASIGSAAPSLEEIAAAFPKLEILRLIGHGGMGFVYQARQPELDRMVALKILSPVLRCDPAFEERFAREARVLGKLQHPNIVTLFEHGESGGFFYLMMEYIDGVNLRQAMAAGRFTPEQAPAICDALQSAHAQDVWHRDIKPENILLDRDGRVKIADFGIARILGDPERNFTLTRTGGMLGSAAYMAPEQHEKPHDVDHRADIYSLGVVIYEMLTGELPLGRFPAPSRRAAVNARIDEIVMRTLEKERELRQQSANEVKTDVEGLRATKNVVNSRPRKNRWIWKSGIAAFVGMFLGILGYQVLVRRNDSPHPLGYQKVEFNDSIRFSFSHPRAKKGGCSIQIPLRVSANWIPESGQVVTLNDGSQLWVKTRVKAANRETIITEVASSIDQIDWYTQIVVMDTSNRTKTAYLQNGTKVDVQLMLVGDEIAIAKPEDAPRAAMVQILRAARNHNGRVFESGLSRSMKAAMIEEGQDPSKTFGDFDKVAILEAKMVDEKTAEVVVEATNGTKRRITFQMILEDGAWKLTDHGL